MTGVTILALAFGGAVDEAVAASTITLGSNLPEATGFERSCECTFVQTTGANTDTFIAPFDGAITRWRVRNAREPMNRPPVVGFALRVLQFNGVNKFGTRFTALATSAHEIPGGRGVETFATHLPVKAGQYVALDDPEEWLIGEVAGAGAHLIAHPSPADGIATTYEGEEAGELTYNFDLLPAPTISGVAAAAGPSPGETAVGISGASFEEVEAVVFGGSPLGGTVVGGKQASFAVRDEHLITTVVPAGVASGRVAVAVVTPAGVATGSIDYTAPGSGAGPVAPSSLTPPPPPATCVVPKLTGRKLKASKKRIRAADCRVGKLTKRAGARAGTGRVVKEVPKPGTVVPAGTKVTVTLAKP